MLELLDSWGRILWGLSDRFSQPSSKKNVVPELCSLWSANLFDASFDLFAVLHSKFVRGERQISMEVAYTMETSGESTTVD